ncbi:HAMP domain-containing histidine kinase [Luteimonas sp. SJ-92]|uniref:histidine kinase n=1 Tax=Luteimonas salinisoli TaxID=2752307 RepID=A0A853JEJ6_9GAMM|nr:HAMP domain-containing sensor histidine kinase [Luteimonas salinisoli]NZA27184.1 HAMP domain-containing histidine kinase [Luteimonas salinisoli]
MSAPRRGLHRRVMLMLTGFTLGVAALFGAYAITFMYAVEDRFFEAQLEDEAAWQLRQRAATGAWAVPRSAHVRLHEDAAELPDEVRTVLEREPRRVEFPGRDGRHYHLHALDDRSGARAWLVAEVSGQLVVRPMRGRILQLLGWSAAAVVLLALLAGHRLARRTTAPLSRLAAAVADMRPDRLPEAVPGGFGDEETAVLARGLDDLVGRIREFIAREQEFTRDASHELRTPLAVIRSAGERLAREPGLGDAARTQLDHIRQSAAQLEQTVDMLLALAREGDAQPAAPAPPARVLPVLERVVVEQAPLLEDKAVSVDVQVAPDASMPVPQAVLHVLLSNLVGNAFAHTAAGEVGIAMDAGTLRIFNTGHAIEPALRDSLYQPFARREGSAGFGLGLAIARRLCARHGLELHVDGDARGITTTLAAAGTPPPP